MRERDGSASVVLHPAAGDVVSFGPFRFDRANRLLSRDGAEVPLPPRVLGVLEHLAARPGTVVSKQALMDAVWRDAYVTDTSLTEAVSLLRQALGDDPQQPAYVQTVHRRGYRFVAPVTVDGGAPAAPLRIAESKPADEEQTAPGVPSRPTSHGLVGVFAAIALSSLAVAGWSLLRPRPEAGPALARVTILLPPSEGLGYKALPALSLSPDGSRLVFALVRGGRSQLYVRPLDQFEATPVAGTEGGTSPFFSPNGEWLGFFADGKLKKVSLAGGPPVTLCDSAGAFGASWSRDGTIVFAPSQKAGLMRVAEAGGTPESLAQPDAGAGELGYWWPEVLPGGRAVVFTIWPTAGLEQARLAVVAIPSHSGRGEGVRAVSATPRLLVEGATYARSVTGGQLVFARKSRLMALPIDPRTAEPKGPPVALFDGIGVDWFTGAAQFAISETGTLAYVPGTHEVPNNTLAFVDREGRERPLPTPARPFMNLALTSDGSRVAATIHEGTGSDIWVSDTARGALGRLTFEAHNIEPVFTPDGKRVTFASSRSGPYNIFWLPADGGGAVEALLTSPRNQYPESWSPDGRTLLFTELHPETGSDLWVLTLGERQPKPLLVTRFDESAAAFSPDGRSIAYVSNETGRHEVFVHPYPASGPRWRVSTDGGAWPFWSTDGRELYYLTDDTCMAVEVAGGAEPSFTSPQPLFPARDIVAAAAAPGGRGFIVVRGPGAAAPVQVNLVLGWLSELSRLAPGGS